LRSLVCCAATSRDMRRVFMEPEFWAQLCQTLPLSSDISPEHCFRAFVTEHLKVRRHHRSLESPAEALRKDGIWSFDRIPGPRRLLFLIIAAPITLIYVWTTESLRFGRRMTFRTLRFLVSSMRAILRIFSATLRMLSRVVRALADRLYRLCRTGERAAVASLKLLTQWYNKYIQPWVDHACMRAAVAWNSQLAPMLRWFSHSMYQQSIHIRQRLHLILCTLWSDHLCPWIRYLRAQLIEAGRRACSVARMAWAHIVRPPLSLSFRLLVQTLILSCLITATAIPWNTQPVLVALWTAWPNKQQLKVLAVEWPVVAARNLPLEVASLASTAFAPWRFPTSCSLLFRFPRSPEPVRSEQIWRNLVSNVLGWPRLLHWSVVRLCHGLSYPLRVCYHQLLLPTVGAAYRLVEGAARACIRSFGLLRTHVLHPLVGAAWRCYGALVIPVRAVWAAAQQYLIQPVRDAVALLTAQAYAAAQLIRASAVAVLHPLRQAVHELLSALAALRGEIRKEVSWARARVSQLIADVRRMLGFQS